MILLAVFLSTVLTPSFGWEVAAARGPHDCHVGEAEDAGGTNCGADSDHFPGNDAHHHEGCAGHMLGHLVANVSDQVTIHVPELGKGLPTEHLAASPRGFAERIDRPPRTRLF